MNILQKSIKHLNLINKHKYEVFKLCWIAGLKKQAFTHDLSKYSPKEFFEYAKYFDGKVSPVARAKEDKGYCLAWQHHRGHNPHHYEYWIDNLDFGGEPLVMPYRYALEMVCDYIAAGKIYNSENFNNSAPLEYWNEKKKTAKIHPQMIKYFDFMFKEYKYYGDRILNNKLYNLKAMYKAYVYNIF